MNCYLHGLKREKLDYCYYHAAAKMTSFLIRYLIRMHARWVSLKCVTSHITRLTDKKDRMSTSLEHTPPQRGKQNE